MEISRKNRKAFFLYRFAPERLLAQTKGYWGVMEVRVKDKSFAPPDFVRVRQHPWVLLSMQMGAKYEL